LIGTIKVGHAQDVEALTGCTVFLPPEGTVGACEVRGGAPGTRETELLRPTFTVTGPNAVLITGGSAFGLSAASGVVRFLEEKGIGFPTSGGLVPVVSAAVLFDLDLGDARVRPDEQMAYQACRNATVGEDREGLVGAGTGASVGNARGRQSSVKGGFGLYRFLGGDFNLEVAAVANSFGDVVDVDGTILGGARSDDGSFLGAEKFICNASGLAHGCAGQNTTLVVIATNAKLDKEQGARMALQGHHGIARAIRPSHTRFDGDTVFVLATGEVDAPPDAVEILAAMGTAEAIRSSVLRATAAGGLPCACDILNS
jgi:L-aminopeptidase/D-esterase-like protein